MNPIFINILLALPHLIGLCFSVHSLLQRRSPQGTIAWILGLNLLPYICIPLYLALGAGRIHRRIGHRLPPDSVRRMLEPILPFTLQEAQGIQRTLQDICGYAPCYGNSLDILQDGKQTYTSLVEQIRAAQQTILLEFFIIRNDRVGNILRELLEERARAGVQVYVIYDEIGSHKLPRGYLKALQQAGVHVASFNGRRFWLSSILRINYRNHRKLVIVDGKTAFLGSLNIGIEYVARRNTPYWRDTFVRLQGPIVNQCLLSFAEDWQRANAEDITPLLATQPQEFGNTECQLIPSGPDNTPINAWQLLLQELAAHAQQRLWLASPYLVPNEAVHAALRAASLRGVDVRILVPRKGDNLAAHLAMLTYLPELTAAGVQVVLYTKGFLHEKIVLCDNDLSCIGTANLDERSLNLNYELTLLSKSDIVASNIEKMLLEDMHSSYYFQTSKEHYSFLTIICAHICRLLAPTL